MMKTWNVRDQTSKALEELLLKKYSEIDRSYKLLKKLSKAEDAKKMVDEIYHTKAFCNELEVELYKRRLNNEAQS
jgi:hypothetical protein